MTKKICPACMEKCTKLYEITIGGVQRIRVCFRCKRAHLAYERELARKKIKAS